MKVAITYLIIVFSLIYLIETLEQPSVEQVRAKCEKHEGIRRIYNVSLIPSVEDSRIVVICKDGYLDKVK